MLMLLRANFQSKHSHVNVELEYFLLHFNFFFHCLAIKEETWILLNRINCKIQHLPQSVIPVDNKVKLKPGFFVQKCIWWWIFYNQCILGGFHFNVRPKSRVFLEHSLNTQELKRDNPNTILSSKNF